MNDTNRDLDDQVAGCAAAHQVLLANIGKTVDEARLDPTEPSLLPGWTVGHVLTHLARNANANQSMIEGAAAGEARPMYPSAQHRNDDINRGASRSAQELLDDLRNAIWSLESCWAQLSEDAWNGHGLVASGQLPIRIIPMRRWREVEVHHADLGRRFGPSDWSPDYVKYDLRTRTDEWLAAGNEFPPDVAMAEPCQRLAWLFGRSSGLASPPAQWG